MFTFFIYMFTAICTVSPQLARCFASCFSRTIASTSMFNHWNRVQTTDVIWAQVTFSFIVSLYTTNFFLLVSRFIIFIIMMLQPHRCEPLLTGWITDSTMLRHDKRNKKQRSPKRWQWLSTHTQPCEQLLAGWIVGATNDSEDDEGSRSSGTMEWEWRGEPSR